MNFIKKKKKKKEQYSLVILDNDNVLESFVTLCQNMNKIDIDSIVVIRLHELYTHIDIKTLYSLAHFFGHYEIFSTIDRNYLILKKKNKLEDAKLLPIIKNIKTKMKNCSIVDIFCSNITSNDFIQFIRNVNINMRDKKFKYLHNEQKFISDESKISKDFYNFMEFKQINDNMFIDFCKNYK